MLKLLILFISQKSLFWKMNVLVTSRGFITLVGGRTFYPSKFSLCITFQWLKSGYYFGMRFRLRVWYVCVPRVRFFNFNFWYGENTVRLISGGKKSCAPFVTYIRKPVRECNSTQIVDIGPHPSINTHSMTSLSVEVTSLKFDDVTGLGELAREYLVCHIIVCVCVVVVVVSPAAAARQHPATFGLFMC